MNSSILLSEDDVVNLREKYKREGKKLVFTNGCFDIIHVGHIKLLKKSKQIGDILIVGLNSDDSVRRLKGKGRPINKIKDRIEVLSAIRYVDHIIVFDEDTPYNLINRLRPDVLVKGGDYKPDDVIGRDIVEGNGGEVVILPLVKGQSTTKILDRIQKYL